MALNAHELAVWLGDELQNIIRTTDNTNRFTASRDLVAKAIHLLEELQPNERAQFQDLLIISHQSNMIGDFRIPYDIRDESDCIEEILATIEGDLES